MASCELRPSQETQDPHEEGCEEDEESSEACGFSDDSDEDPTFDVLEETRSKLSRMSLKKSRPRTSGDEKLEAVGIEIPELDKKDDKCFEKVEKLIKDGQLEKLKVDQCKVYLRKYGCRLTGNKDILIARIREHLEVLNGGGEKKYPQSSFVLNCKGDACTGDVVMFEQRVYEMYSIASRSATGPPCGTRTVVGRIVKESYGAAKQQHTFTIEVLWSKGEKPLPPLHPLLIKGRNLYRLKTVRQKWANEDERRKVLQEKHTRGSFARCSRENRVQEKEMRKMGGIRRMKGNKSDCINRSEKENQQAMDPQMKGNKSDCINRSEKENRQAMDPQIVDILQQNIQHPQELLHQPKSDAPRKENIQARHQNIALQQPHGTHSNTTQSLKPQALKPLNYEYLTPAQAHSNAAQQQQREPFSPLRNQRPQHQYGTHAAPHFHAEHKSYRQQSHGLRYAGPRGSFSSSNSSFWSPQPQHNQQQRQPCRFHQQGRCYYGDTCKYIHN